MFDFKNPDKILKILLSQGMNYEEILEISNELLFDIKTPHTKITGQKYPSAITQCILECYKIKNNFKSSLWQSAKFLNKDEIKENEKPIVFSRLVAKGEVVDYEIYNFDQLNINLDEIEQIKPEVEKNSKEKVKSKKKKLDLKEEILFCVKEFSGQYGKGGIAKILKGSQSIKDNEYNNASINSRFYGLFEHLTINSITSAIENLIDEEKLVVKKIAFGRPTLDVAKEIKDKLKEGFKIESKIETDENVLKILNLLNQGKNVFVTGHAGTGKSYILNKLKENIEDLVITSTTGIAAVNVKGQTLHSWCGVGICNRPINYTVEKILSKKSMYNQIKNCTYLALDEVSMLDVKTFEYVNQVLKLIRENNLPFGGIQVIFIGDFFQLPPVEKENESSKKFIFETSLWDEFKFSTIILNKNYRQNEPELIKALANMRINQLTYDDIKLLSKRECKNANIDDALHIFATNQEADDYNNLKFKNINSKEYILPAVDGVYHGKKLIQEPTNEKEIALLNRIDSICNAEKEILLKVGARVMLLINLDFERGLINGSCGVVKEICESHILVKFDNGQYSKIAQHDFEFYKNDVLIASRKQYPLRLAYGITIHKSQGMSLDKLVVDCLRIFEKGQAYVALSRIKTLDGLYLKNFNANKVMVDDRVVEFYENLK